MKTPKYFLKYDNREMSCKDWANDPLCLELGLIQSTLQTRKKDSLKTPESYWYGKSDSIILTTPKMTSSEAQKLRGPRRRRKPIREDVWRMKRQAFMSRFEGLLA